MRKSSRRGIVAAFALAGATAGCATAAQQPSDAVRPITSGPGGVAQAANTKADMGRQSFTAADVSFLSGMIGHHAQAVLMAGWAPSHGASQSVKELCERIVVAQTDEIKFMQGWLGEHHQPVPPADPRGHAMAGMDHPMLMPGMLSPEQMAQLDAARGPEFDRLFLTFMIQHHKGAISMVDALFATNGAAQDEAIFKFASDVNADQTTEIGRMYEMLDSMK
jgi:uncharacterized protein (DUF305 family)